MGDRESSLGSWEALLKVIVLVFLAVAFLLLAVQSRILTKQRDELERLREHVERLEEQLGVFRFIRDHAPRLSLARQRELAQLIAATSRRYHLDGSLIAAVIKVESNFDPHALSKEGARGLMQVMPQTGQAVAEELGLTYERPEDLYDARINILIGTRYLHTLLRRFRDLTEALRAYNRGPSRTSTNTLGLGSYVEAVLAYYALSSPGPKGRKDMADSPSKGRQGRRREKD